MKAICRRRIISYAYFAASLIAVLVLLSVKTVLAQQPGQFEAFEKIEMLVTEGEKVREVRVRVRFSEDAMIIEPLERNAQPRNMKYTDIRSADYSYTKSPRWKAGLGLGATAVIFPPILLIAIPLGFTKHRSHWVTIRGENEYAVLKVSKSVRKVFMPAFETRTKVRIEALGENK
jgi:hypothetical protein